MLGLSSLSQTDFRPGYILTNDNDSIFGAIDYRGDLYMGQTCTFKDSSGVIKDYNPDGLQAYRFIDEKYYVTKEINAQKVFLEYLVNGIISVYYIRNQKSEHYYIEKEGEDLAELPYREEYMECDGKKVIYESKKHNAILSYLMQDAPELSSQIYAIQKPNHHSLIKIAKNYHSAVCDGESCIVYDKKKVSLKVFPEVVAGLINFTAGDYKYLHKPQGGLLLHTCLPKVNEKVFLKTGLFYAVIGEDYDPSRMKIVPIQLEYIYPGSRFSPSIALGANVYSPIEMVSVFYTSETSDQLHRIGLALSAGLQVKLTNHLHWTIQGDLSCLPNKHFFLAPKELQYYSFSTGIFFKY